MFEIFMAAFGTIFLIFGLAAIVGHVLLLDALLGPRLPKAKPSADETLHRVPSAG
jgi:hypothetical protein